MKLHKDGTLEGTPQEIAEYNRLTTMQHTPAQKWVSPKDEKNPWMPHPLQPPITCGETKSIVDIQLETQKRMNPAERPIARL